MMTIIWNICMRILYFIGAVLFEGFIYYIFREAMINNNIGGFIYIFDIAFVIWVIAEAVVRIISGGSSNIFKWAIGRFF